MPYVIFHYIIFYIFSEATTTVLESCTNSTGKHLFCWSLFLSLKRWSYINICSAWISCTYVKIFFLMDWCHKCLKNTVDPSLFCGEHFYGFSESDLWKHWKKTFISKQTYLYIQFTEILKLFEVLFCSYFKGWLCLQKTVIMLIFLCICIKHPQH